MEDLGSLPAKIEKYQQVIRNTEEYRTAWDGKVKEMILTGLQSVINKTGLKADIDVREGLKNLESIVFSLGVVPSGIYEPVGDQFRKKLYKNNGMLIFQQLFNGKIIVMVGYPHIEEVAKPKQAKTLEIIRPDELTDAYMLRYLEVFFKEIIEWEDYDDDVPQTIGFNQTFQDNGIVKEAID